MTIKRRNFLKAAAGGSILLATGSSPVFGAAPVHKLSPDALGILYDSNLCIGCQACVYACKRANDMPVEHTGPYRVWDNPLDLSAKTLNVIKMHTEGDDFAFIKRHCMHCLEPACVNACPVSALQKDAKSGVVTYDKHACIGCRYCQIVCPYNVPKFEWNDPFPQIRKCQLCDHLFEQGGYSACCESCPTGASLFGPVQELRKEARRRLRMTPGKRYEFPLNHITKGGTTTHVAEPYQDDIYALEELGGSQCMILAGTNFQKLGLPELRKKSYVSDLAGVSKGLYKYMLLPIAAFGGLLYLVKKRDDHE
jgi:Fe-S-cluster-containing dehydrogenase component